MWADLEQLNSESLGQSLARFLADVTGVEDDEIGVLGTCGLGEPGGNQGVRHTMGIVDVHLAAVGFDVELSCLHAVGALPR